MSKLPRDISGDEVRKVLEKSGFVFKRQSGSHMILGKDNPKIRVSVPKHHAIKPGTLKGIIEDSGIALEDFRKLL